MLRKEALHDAASTARHRFPFVTIVLAGTAALASWQYEMGNALVRNFAEVLPSSSWLTWLERWPGSFFVASPVLGNPFDGLLTAILIGLTVGVTEWREGWKRTLSKVFVFQALGCVATRLYEVSGLLPPDKMNVPDVGSSAVTVALIAGLLTEKIQEHSRRCNTLKLAMYGSALVVLFIVTTIGVVALGDPTSAVAHGASVGTGAAVSLLWRRQPAPSYME
jgi:hypothetical protein